MPAILVQELHTRELRAVKVPSLTMQAGDALAVLGRNMPVQTTSVERVAVSIERREIGLVRDPTAI